MKCILPFVLLLTVGLSTVHGQLCICTRTGVSNGVETGTPGCVLEQGAETPTCFVESSTECERANPSAEFQGASFVNCSVEDALFYAAETDDVEQIIRLRELGVSFIVRRDLNTAVFENKRLLLLFHAAAYGSFRVVEDILINRDFVCDRGRSPARVLCELSGGKKCAETDVRRWAIDAFIFKVYEPDCVFFAAYTAAKPRQHPYFVSVRSAYSGGYAHRCGGVLVAKDAVLTAAHCVDGSQGSFDPVLEIEPYATFEGGTGSDSSEVREECFIRSNTTFDCLLDSQSNQDCAASEMVEG